jgi:hypothetical protein
MKTAYTFTVLRYVHDPMTNEFANVGVVLFSPKLNFISALSTDKFGRLSRMFGTVNGAHFRQTVSYIESKIQAEGERLLKDLPLENTTDSILDIVKKVLPKDDSAFQFAPPGSGLTSNPLETLEALYRQYVERYEIKVVRATRTENEVWRTFRKPLEAKKVLSHLTSHEIIAKDYDYKFEHTWKNKVWHAYEPISLDLAEASSIVEKAASWLGKAQSLKDSNEKFKIHLLLGKPSDAKLTASYIRAENILNKMDVPHELVREEEAEAFADDLQKQIASHK